MLPLHGFNDSSFGISKDMELSQLLKQPVQGLAVSHMLHTTWTTYSKRKKGNY